MVRTKTNHTTELSTFSNNLHEAICYSQELSKKICAIFSVRSYPGRVLTVGFGPHFYGFTSGCVQDGVLLSHISYPCWKMKILNSLRRG